MHVHLCYFTLGNICDGASCISIGKKQKTKLPVDLIAQLSYPKMNESLLIVIPAPGAYIRTEWQFNGFRRN